MTEKAWRDVQRHELVELRGKSYEVLSIAVGKKKAVVQVRGDAGKFTSTVKAKDLVMVKPLRDESGSMTRWASKAERKAALPPAEPPKPASGGSWSKPKGEVEKTLAAELGAVLVAETSDEAAGWYVPSLDPSTIASHLLVFHDMRVDESLASWEGMNKLHDDQHARALAGHLELHRNHWHTKKRP